MLGGVGVWERFWSKGGVAVRTMTAIVVALVVSNLLLVGLLLWGQTGPTFLPQVQAQTVARGAKYVAVTGLSSGSVMLVYVIDETTDRMVVYLWDENLNAVRRVGLTDLRSDFQAGAAPAQGGPRR